MLNHKQKAVLHVAKNQLALDDDTYRDALSAHAGVKSSKDMDYQGFKAVMAHFEKSGFKSKFTHARRGATRPHNMATEPQIRKIYASWWALGSSYYRPGQERAALRGFLRKRFRVEHENFLTFQKAHSVIEAIKQIGERTVENSKAN